jgi:acetyl-CoA C-acetyltransferase
MPAAAIIGWHHLPFGRQPETSLEQLIVGAGAGAIRHAGIAPDDIDAIYVGHFNAGFSTQDFPASLALGIDPGLRFKPATRVENACATGSAAIHQGLKEIAAGSARHVLVIGAEQMSAASPAEIAANLLKASYVREEGATPGGFAGIFGAIAAAYFDRHGDQGEALAAIAAKNHHNGVANPHAQIRKDLGRDFCRRVSPQNPVVAGPLKRSDCSPVSDGAAALVLASVDAARSAALAVAFRGIAHVSDFLPMSLRDVIAFEGCRVAWQRAFAAAGVTLADLDLVETHDCFTIAELIEYEAMGLAAPGHGAAAILEGWTEMGGRLPVNPSGGLKAKGHPIGATGVSMHVLGAMQVCGCAGGMQVGGARLAGIFNMGGTAVANYASILERVR